MYMYMVYIVLFVLESFPLGDKIGRILPRVEAVLPRGPQDLPQVYYSVY